MPRQTNDHGITVPARIGLLFKPPAGTPLRVRRVCRRFFAGWLAMTLAAPAMALGSAWLPGALGLVVLAFLPIALLGGTVAVLAYRAHARLVPVAPTVDESRCAHCGYDTSGLDSAGTCPECGRAYERLADEPPA